MDFGPFHTQRTPELHRIPRMLKSATSSGIIRTYKPTTYARFPFTEVGTWEAVVRVLEVY